MHKHYVYSWLAVSENYSTKKQGGNVMNINKFTQKSLQAINELEKIAYEYGNQEIGKEN